MSLFRSDVRDRQERYPLRKYLALCGAVGGGEILRSVGEIQDARHSDRAYHILHIFSRLRTRQYFE